MKKRLVCIECPAGCVLSVEVEGGRAIKTEGGRCPNAATWAAAEIENPVRILTSTVAATGLALKMVPVRTDSPISKQKISEAMAEVRKITLDRPVSGGDIIVQNFLGLGVNLVATRSIPSFDTP